MSLNNYYQLSGHESSRRNASVVPWRRRPTTSISSCSEIDYDKLKTLCVHFPLTERVDHEAFMKEYPSIFLKKNTTTLPTLPTKHVRPHTCIVPAKQTAHDIKFFTAAIHKRRDSSKAMEKLNTHFQTILTLVKKLPIQRNSAEVKELSSFLAKYSNLFPLKERVTKSDLFTGLASRVTLESVPSKGYMLPNKGSLYLVLKGSVEKLTQDEQTKDTQLTILLRGDYLGSLEDEVKPQGTRDDYPVYTSAEACALLRIKTVDYNKVIENCKKVDSLGRQELVRSCPLLYAMNQSILTKLGSALTWETVPPYTTIAWEGDLIDKVSIIREGQCTAFAKVPGTKKNLQIFVGKLGPGDCLGEVYLLNGKKRHPYTITTLTHTRMGSISSSVIIGNEVQKHILSDRTLSLPVLTEEQLRNKYASKVMKKQWTKIKEHVIDEVVLETGIEFGTKKWIHSTEHTLPANNSPAT